MHVLVPGESRHLSGASYYTELDGTAVFNKVFDL
jgi:hypothetical protein